MVACVSNLHRKHKNQVLCFLILCEEILPIVFTKTEDFTLPFRMISKASSASKKLALTVCTFYLSTTYCFSCFFPWGKMALLVHYWYCYYSISYFSYFSCTKKHRLKGKAATTAMTIAYL